MLFSQRQSITLVRRFDGDVTAIDILLGNPNSEGGWGDGDKIPSVFLFVFMQNWRIWDFPRREVAIAECSIKRCCQEKTQGGSDDERKKGENG